MTGPLIKALEVPQLKQELYMKHIKGLFHLTCALSLISSGVYAQSYISSQSHNGNVSGIAIAAANDNTNNSSESNVFFSAGNDGFVIKWNTQGQGEHYQVSDMNIQNMDVSPDGNEIVIYESNGLSTNRISVLDWRNFNKKFTKRFKSTITSLSYSAKGTYLIVGTAAVNGTYVLNAKTGMVQKNIKDITGIITMAKTGESEKTAVLYSPSGYLYYYDIKNGKIKAKFQTETALDQVTLFGTANFANRFLAGVKNNEIFIIDATTGKSIAIYNVTSPMIVAAKNDMEEGLYYISKRGRAYSMSLISQDTLSTYLKDKNSVPNTPESTFIKNFQGLKSTDSFCSIAKNQESIFLGTQSGDIYTISDLVESETYSLMPITQNNFQNVMDIASDNQKFYFLTQSQVFEASFMEKTANPVVANPGQTNFYIYQDSFIFWSKDSRNPVQMQSIFDLTNLYTLFTPKNKLKTMHIYDDKILYIEGNNSVNIYDMASGKSKQVYFGPAIEDAAVIGDSVYVAKAATSLTDTSLIAVSLSTGETVPVQINGTVTFSLSTNSENMVYGIAMDSKNDDVVTQVFSYDTKAKFYRSLLRVIDEDPSAFTILCNDSLYTNIGRSHIYTYNTKINRSSSFKRSSSVPLSAIANSEYLLVLNKDGSISWYMPSSKGLIASWYLTDSNEWWEF